MRWKVVRAAGAGMLALLATAAAAIAGDGLGPAPGPDAAELLFDDPSRSVVFYDRATLAAASTGFGAGGETTSDRGVEPADEATSDGSPAEFGVRDRAVPPRLYAALPQPREGTTRSGEVSETRGRCSRELIQGMLCYRCDGILYQPVYYAGRVFYRSIAD